LNKATHLLALEHPKEVAQLIKNFVNDIRP